MPACSDTCSDLPLSAQLVWSTLEACCDAQRISDGLDAAKIDALFRIRENIDLGRPEQVQLIFDRKMKRKTATDGRCRTRIITEGVTPSLHVYYKNTHLKQYHKEGYFETTGKTLSQQIRKRLGL